MIRNKLFVLLIAGIFLLSLVSANDYRFENSSGYNLIKFGDEEWMTN